MNEPLALLRLKEVCRRVGRSPASLYRDIAAGAFPQPVRIGANASAWPEHEVAAWIAERMAERVATQEGAN